MGDLAEPQGLRQGCGPHGGLSSKVGNRPGDLEGPTRCPCREQHPVDGAPEQNQGFWGRSDEFFDSAIRNVGI